MDIIAKFLDHEGKIKQLPSNKETKRAVLAYLAGQFSYDLMIRNILKKK